MEHRAQQHTHTPIAFYRLPSQVMRLSRMGSAHPTRLSFLRILLRRVGAEGWRFDRPVWDIDDKGVGRAVFCARGPKRTYSLIAFSHDLPADMRSDRVIAQAWDATFALFDGVPTVQDLDRLQSNVPHQEAGRVTSRELTLSRANRSVRLFEHVVNALANGGQPDISEIDAVGYLMRTTAVYGSGKFGAADRSAIAQRPEFSAPFQAEMLTVWMIRWFTIDIVNHLAKVKGGERAASLDMDIARRLGVGNSTGLGMAPFLIRHPALINNWMFVREEALARIRAQDDVGEGAHSGLWAALAFAKENAKTWGSDHPVQAAKLADLRADLERIETYLHSWPQGAKPWNTLWQWAEHTLSKEGQEALVSIMLEPHGALIDGLAECMSADEQTTFRINGAQTIGDLTSILQNHYAWALEIDFDCKDTTTRFWYVSEEKLEPRLGDRFTEDGAELEQPLGIARLAKDLYAALADWDPSAPVAEFLLSHPQHRLMVRRAQIAPTHPYAEVQDNLNARDMLPIDLLRCKLAFFGATHFDPRSDKWVRISLFGGTPFPFEMQAAKG